MTHDTATLLTPAEFGARIGKSADWVRKHLDEIPHRVIGSSARFTEADYEDYLDRVRRGPRLMDTTGKRRRPA